MAFKKLLALAAGACVVSSGEAVHELTVSTANGPVVGFVRGTTGTFWGMRYAEPPVGNLRYRRPQALNQTWTKPWNATVRKADCGHYEDCLYLNVYTPVSALKPGAAKRPVMVYIFGGGFTKGDSWSSGLFDGQMLSQQYEMLVVTMEYRLSQYGFLALDALRHEDEYGSTGNYGVQDQQESFRWIQRNIANFGGDPSRVMIYGQSAGADSVMWHLVSPQSEGLFSAAALSSGTASVTWFFQPYELANAFNEELAAHMGCPNTGPSGYAQQLSCLRSKSTEEMEAASKALRASKPGGGPAVRSPLYPMMPYGPVIDGSDHGLLDVPINLANAGRFLKVPLIVGANNNDGSLFDDLIPDMVPNTTWPAFRNPENVPRFKEWMLANYTAEVDAVYSEQEYRDSILPGDAFESRMIRDLMFMCTGRALSTAWTKHGVPAYLYAFNYYWGLWDKVSIGDFHGGEGVFFFRALELLALGKILGPASHPLQMANIVGCKWASLLFNGDPNGGADQSQWPPNCKEVHRKFEAWPVYSLEQRNYYALQAEPKVHAISSTNRYPDDLFPRDPKCDLWDRLDPVLPFIGQVPRQLIKAETASSLVV